MALNASGPIILGGSTVGQSINLELGLGATVQISLDDAAVRTLAGKPSGTIIMPTDFWGKSSVKYGGAVLSYSLGTGGPGGVNTNSGTAGGTTTLTYAGITLTANGGGAGGYNNGVSGSGGTASGGTSSATGGFGGSVSGDRGGGGGGGLNGASNSSHFSGVGQAGQSPINFQGLSTALTGTGYSLGTGGSGASSGSSSVNAMNGSPGTGIGAGGGGAGWYGGNGGAGGFGGGGGGAAGFSASNRTGGVGGNGIVVVRSFNNSSYSSVVLISGTSYALPGDSQSFEVWAIGAGGGGAGATASDGTSGGAGGAGGIAYRQWT